MYKLSADYKTHKSGAYKSKRMTNRGAFYGEFRVYASGKKVYFAARLPDEQVHKMQGAWALDAVLDGWLKMLGAEFLGVAVSKRESRNIDPKNVAMYYLISVNDYFAHRRKDPWDFTGHSGAKRKGGSRQWLIDPMFMQTIDRLTEKERLEWMLRVPT